MPLSLHPFPEFYHPPFGVVDELPYCRDGVRNLPDGTLLRYTRPTFAELHIRRHVNAAHSRGICGLLPATAFLDGTVRPHEATLESRLQRQEELIMAERGALGKPILLTVPQLTDWWATHDQDHHATGRNIDFVGQDNDYSLRSYERKDERVTSLLSLTGLGPICIADGHHRAATHARLAARGVEECAYLPVCIIGAEDLYIGTFLRVIETPALSTDTLFSSLKNFFRIQPTDALQAPAKTGEWLLVHRSLAYRLQRLPAPTEPSLDNRWLEEKVLPQVFGIHNTRSDDRISFEPVTDLSQGLVDFTPDPEKIYLCGFPLPKERFFEEVRAGRMLPPKSTRFEPRVPSGMVVWMPEQVFRR